MKAFSVLVVFSLFWASLSAFVLPSNNKDTLRLVHALFRHGGRNPDEASILTSSPFYNESFYPEGYGQLTNDGKRTEYNIGTTLRTRYNNFLGRTWNINDLEARSTNINRTKMSLELVLAGLYPPRGNQIWSRLPWQPIPFNYLPTTEDKEMQFWSACSTYFYGNLTLNYETPESVEYLKRYEELFAILEEKSGVSPITISTAFSYYFGFVTQQEVGYPLEEWTKAIYPEPIRSAAVDYYYYITNTTDIRRIGGGNILKKILADTKAKIDGTISPSSRKMFLYSAHEMNVASFLLSLDAFKLTSVPAYGAHVLFEVHEIDGVWGIKLFYQNWEQPNPLPLRIPGCDYFCPYDQFYSLVEEILPESDADCSA